jgi:uncharacterized membrane protein (UPF0127 family)
MDALAHIAEVFYTRGGCWNLALAMHEATGLPLEVVYRAGVPVRCIKLGVPVQPPKLPRSRRLRQALEVEAGTNTRVWAALDAAKAGKPSKHRRLIAEPEIRIY